MHHYSISQITHVRVGGVAQVVDYLSSNMGPWVQTPGPQKKNKKIMQIKWITFYNLPASECTQKMSKVHKAMMITIFMIILKIGIMITINHIILK
jgi:hypothetical protein